MAIVEFGPTVVGISGTIGGITFSRNKSGPYATNWYRSTNPNSQDQSRDRGQMGSLPQQWRDLTQQQRDDWDTYAGLIAQKKVNSLGQNYYISGYNWFCSCNNMLLWQDRVTIQPPPVQARPAAPTIDDFRVCVPGSESDLCICGVPSCSTFLITNPAPLAFDNNLATFWATENGTTTGWIRYDLCDPANIKRYRIYSIHALWWRQAKEWDFQVWTGGQWVTIHSVTNHIMDGDQWHDFYCANPYTETDYRLEIHANQGHADMLLVAELEFYAADVGASVICYPEDEFDAAPDYDLTALISGNLSKGRLSPHGTMLFFLYPQFPGRWYIQIQSWLEYRWGTVMANKRHFLLASRQTQEGRRSGWTSKYTDTQET